MSTKAEAVLEQIKALPPGEQREIGEWCLRHVPVSPPARRQRPISEIAGKYRARPAEDAKDHDRGFAEAAAS